MFVYQTIHTTLAVMAKSKVILCLLIDFSYLSRPLYIPGRKRNASGMSRRYTVLDSMVHGKKVRIRFQSICWLDYDEGQGLAVNCKREGVTDIVAGIL